LVAGGGGRSGNKHEGVGGDLRVVADGVEEVGVGLPTVRPSRRREERRGGAPVAERGKRLAGQLREDALELKARLVQAEQLRWSGATVSSCSPAFGRR
jgi:hypothetical protein